MSGGMHGRGCGGSVHGAGVCAWGMHDRGVHGGGHVW